MSKRPEFTELFFSKTKDYLDIFLKRQEQRSDHTIKAYRISLSMFYTFVTGEKGIHVMRFCFSDCTYEFVLSYSQYLQENKGLANSTVNQRLAALKSYLKYVSDGDISLMQTYMAIQKVPFLKTPKLQRPIIEKGELKALLSEPGSTRTGRRDRVILILLFDSAVRVTELTDIVLGDLTLDIAHPSIIIHGKGKKYRSIVMSEKCAAQVRDYVLHYHKPDAPSDTPLFYSIIHGKMNHMSQRNVERIVKKYGNLIREKHPCLPDGEPGQRDYTGTVSLWKWYPPFSGIPIRKRRKYMPSPQLNRCAMRLQRASRMAKPLKGYGKGKRMKYGGCSG